MTREELYQLVWKVPALHVARQLGMANGTFRALCATYNIPLPPAGYWTKLAYGKAPQPSPLPDTAPKLVQKLNLSLLKIGEAAIDITNAQIADYSLVGLTSGAPSRPAIVEDIASRLHATEADGEGVVSLDAPGLLSVDVAVASVRRAIEFLEALFVTATRLGFSVPKDFHDGFVFDDEPFAIRLYQALPKGDEGRNTGTDRLCLEIVDPRPLQWQVRNLIGHWHDRKDRPLEEIIGIALAAAVNAAPLIKQARSAVGEAPTQPKSPVATKRDLRDLAKLREELRGQAANKALSPRMSQLLAGLLAEMDSLSDDDKP